SAQGDFPANFYLIVVITAFLLTPVTASLNPAKNQSVAFVLPQQLIRAGSAVVYRVGVQIGGQDLQPRWVGVRGAPLDHDRVQGCELVSVGHTGARDVIIRQAADQDVVLDAGVQRGGAGAANHEVAALAAGQDLIRTLPAEHIVGGATERADL